MSSYPPSVILVAAVSGICSWIILYGLIPYLRLRILDQPSKRSSHSIPKPSGGGLSFVILSCVVSLLDCFFWFSDAASVNTPLIVAPLVAFPLSLVGLLDDRFNLPASWRYFVQLSTALLVVLLSPLLTPSLVFLPLLFLLIIAVTAVINFTNFMDGLDGLVAGCMVLILAAAALELSTPWSIWVTIGALLGFLFWNWSPSKVFMGDVGSTFLGAVFTILVLQSSSWSEALALLLIATPLLGDACICVLRRFFGGQQIFMAHRLHLFQRLQQAGWPHARVSLTYIAATAVLALAMLAGGWPWVFSLAVAELLVGVWLDQRVAVPFSVASKN